MASHKRPFYYGIATTALPTVLLLWFVGWAPVSGPQSFSVAWFYLAMSVFTFIVYALDKTFAANNRWRISELTLHSFSVCGGWPGAWIAQRLLHHKTNKPSFQRVFWITVIVNCALFFITTS